MGFLVRPSPQPSPKGRGSFSTTGYPGLTRFGEFTTATRLLPVFDSPRKCRNRFAVECYFIRAPRVGRSGQPWAGCHNRVAVKNLLVKAVGRICGTYLVIAHCSLKAVSPGSDRSNFPAERRVYFSNSTSIEEWLETRVPARVRRANVPSRGRTTNDSKGHRRDGCKILEVLRPSQPRY